MHTGNLSLHALGRRHLLSWHVNTYLKLSESRERSLAVESEGKAFRKAFRLSEVLALLFKIHFVFNSLKDVHWVSWDLYLKNHTSIRPEKTKIYFCDGKGLNLDKKKRDNCPFHTWAATFNFSVITQTGCTCEHNCLNHLAQTLPCQHKVSVPCDRAHVWNKARSLSKQVTASGRVDAFTLQLHTDPGWCSFLSVEWCKCKKCSC